MNKFDKLIDDLNKLGTEQRNSTSEDIDQKSAREIVGIINNEDKKVASVVESQLEKIALVAELYAETLKNGGRIFYIGAGTSGRLGVLDAAECPPTFGTEPEQIVGVISGGYDTLVLSQEGVEDREDKAVEDLKARNLNRNDFIIGIAASRRTPYTLSGLKYGKSLGCKTGFIICNQWDETTADFEIDHIIELPVGPEVITGSTRMKSGTAQKMTLNLISTTAMVLMGKTMGNLMVDLQARSDKLSARSRKILIDLFSITSEEAGRLIKSADGSVKRAIVMKKFDCSKDEADKKIRDAEGFINRI